MSVAYYYHSYELPWSLSQTDERRFRRIVLICLALVLLFGLIIPFLPVTRVEQVEVTEVPPRLAKIIMERRTPPPPPPPPKVEEKKPEPKKEAKKKPEPKKEVKKKPEPKKKVPEPTRQAARKKAKSAGILAFADDLADLRQNPSVDKLSNKPLSEAGSKAKRTERSMVTSSAGRGSGGINTASLSRDTGGRGLAGRSTTQVESKTATAVAKARTRTERADRRAARSAEEISLVFDRNKSAIYRIYSRALRADPTLQGKVVVRFTIAPSGEVTNVSIVSSELGDSELERKLALRIKRFDFGAKDVAEFTGTYPIDFFPS